MKKKLYLHIGYHKTGTTAIQEVLYNNFNELLNQNLYYPIEYTEDRQHLFIFRQIIKENYDILESNLKDIYQKAKKYDTNLLISSEKIHILSSLQQKYLFNKIYEIFFDFDIEVIVYLRSQEDFIESYYNQLVKFGDEYGSPEEFFNKHFWMLDYYEYLNQLCRYQIFSRLNIKIYDKGLLINGNIIDDFCNLININKEKLEILNNGFKNNSLDKKYFEFKKNMNFHLKGSSTYLLMNIAGILEDATSYNGKQSDTQIFSDFENFLIKKLFLVSNKKLFDKFIPCENGFPEIKKVNKFGQNRVTEENYIASLLAHMFRYIDHNNFKLYKEIQDIKKDLV